MAAPNLAARNALYVNYVGTDDLGYDAIGKPWSYLSITRALASLAVQSNPPSAINPWAIAVGPGSFIEAGLILPAWVWITGCADSETGQNTVILLSGNVTLDSSWANGAAQGGFSNLVFRVQSGTPIMDFTMPAPSGNPARTLQLENITHNLRILYFDATGTGDIFDAKRVVQDGTAADLIHLQNGTHVIDNLNSQASVSIQDGNMAVACSLYGLFLGSAASLTIAAATNAVAVTIAGSKITTLILNRTAPGSLAVSADAISLPIRSQITISGTVALTRLNDAFGEAYTPSTPGNWPTQPTTVQSALDILAANGGGGGGATQFGTAETLNAAGNTTISPGAIHHWTEQINFSGSAGTRIVILDESEPPTAGDVISVYLSRTDGAGIVIQVRAGSAGGTLLATFADGSGTTTAVFSFVYGTIAQGYPADEFVAQAFQIPATI